MKRVLILLTAVSVFAVIGCKNKITINFTEEENQTKAMLTIQEAGGTPSYSMEDRRAFLNTSEFEGVFATEAGSVGYKIKDSEIYYVERVQETKKQVWKKIPDDIAVDRNLNKLQLINPESGRLEVLTFDGFGYRSYIQGEAVRYYRRYDYLDNFAGTWKSSDGFLKHIEIATDGCITLYYEAGSLSSLTAQTILDKNTLTIKGGVRDRIIFEVYEDGTPKGQAVYVYASGARFQLNRQ